MALETRLATQVIRFRALVILAGLTVVGLAGPGLGQLSFSTDYRVFFGPANPQRIAFEDLEATFSRNDSIVIMLSPTEGDVFTAKFLSVVEQLTALAWHTPYATRVDSVTNFQHIEALDETLVVRNLVPDAETLGDAELDSIRRVALQEPRLVSRLVSASGHVAAVSVTVTLPGLDQSVEVPQVVEYVRQLTHAVQAENPDIETRIAGIVMMNHAFTEYSLLDMQWLIPGAFVGMLVLLWVLLRDLVAVLAASAVIAASIVVAMGVGGYAGLDITPPSAAAPIIIMTVALASAVHLLMTMLGSTPRSAGEVVEASLRVNLQPVFLASFTTALGFLSLNISEVPPFRHLGNLVALGVVCSFAFSVTFLPAVMSFAVRRPSPAPWVHAIPMESIARFVIARRRIVLWVMTIVVVVLSVFVPRNQLNDVFVYYFDESVPFRRDTEYMARNLTGPMQIDYALRAKPPLSVTSEPYLRDLDNLTLWLRSQPEVTQVSALSDVLKTLNRAMHGGDENYYRIPEGQALAAQYLLLLELSMPYGQDLSNRIDTERRSSRLTVSNRIMSSTEALAFDAHVKAWVSEHAPSILPSDGTGAPIMFAHIGQRNIIAMLFAAGAALILISTVLAFAFRSAKIGLVSLVPNLVPGVMGFGLWAIIDGQIGLSLSVVATMTVGIVVDDTVHFLSKYLRARRESGATAEEAVRYAFATVGNALVVTAIVLALGFAVLATSDFELNAGMGLLTAVVIVFALVADFLLLPALLITVDGEKAGK